MRVMEWIVKDFYEKRSSWEGAELGTSLSIREHARLKFGFSDSYLSFHGMPSLDARCSNVGVSSSIRIMG